ncbi:hypothetical protein D3C86_1297520 [compost metagenome]
MHLVELSIFEHLAEPRALVYPRLTRHDVVVSFHDLPALMLTVSAKLSLLDLRAFVLLVRGGAQVEENTDLLRRCS